MPPANRTRSYFPNRIIDAAGQVGPVDYQIGAALNTLMRFAEQDNPLEIWKAAWDLARTTVLADPYLDPIAKTAMSVPDPMFKSEGFLSGLVQRLTR